MLLLFVNILLLFEPYTYQNINATTGQQDYLDYYSCENLDRRNIKKEKYKHIQA